MILWVEVEDKDKTEIMVEGKNRMEVKIMVREDGIKLFIGLIYL